MNYVIVTKQGEALCIFTAYIPLVAVTVCYTSVKGSGFGRFLFLLFTEVIQFNFSVLRRR